MLADLGARVIKVELIDGDPYRHLVAGGHAGRQDDGRQGVDLHRPQAGRRAAASPSELAATADVVVHNARPGVPERLGLGAEQLRADRPGADLGLADRLRPARPGRRSAVHAPVRRRGDRRRRATSPAPR